MKNLLEINGWYKEQFDRQQIEEAIIMSTGKTTMQYAL